MTKPNEIQCYATTGIAMLAEMFPDRAICRRCGCCEVVWKDCVHCGGKGLDGHDCGEDCCCCLDPEENLRCDMCEGRGGWKWCLGRCDEHGKHKKGDSE